MPQPLAHKRIVLTRDPEQARDLASALESLGAEVILFPTVSFAPLEDWEKLDERLRQLDSFDAILFLSRNAVRYIFDRCAQLGIKCEMAESPHCLIAAVGPATAQALTEKGLRVNYVAKNHTSESLVHELRESLAGRRVLLPRSDRGDDRLPKALREIGASVTEVIAYRTCAPTAFDSAILARVRGGEVDAVVFASPSAFYNLRDSIGPVDIVQLSARIQFVAIGPTTSRAIRESGSRVAVEAEDSSAAGLASALAEHHRRGAPTARPA
jgi:uroporphyrinogen III methyltransferase/synthase